MLTGGGPRLTDSNGVPWQGSYVNANSDLTVDLRSDIAAESRAKIVYEYLMQFTDDKDVLATLNFPDDTRSSAFPAVRGALDTIQPNFPPGVLQSDPRYSNIYSNHSMGEDARGPWNEGESIGLGEEWLYVENPRQQVLETDGLTELEPQGTPRTEASVRSADKKLSKQRSSEIRKATPEKKPPVEPVRFAGHEGAPGASRSGRIDAPAGLQVRTPRNFPGAFILFSMSFATKTRKH